MSTYTKTKSTVAVTLPLTALKYLYSTAGGKKLVVELDVHSLKKINEPNTIDEMVAEARFEYFAGKTKGFRNTKKLMAHLEA